MLSTGNPQSMNNALFAQTGLSDENKLLEFYARMIPRMLNAERCRIFIHDPAAEKFRPKSRADVREPRLEAGDGPHKSDGEIVRVPVRSSDGTTITGTIEVLNKKNEGTFGAEDRAFLEELGAHLQSAVEHAYLAQQAFRTSHGWLFMAVRALVTSFIVAAAAVFLSVFVTLYGGLYPWFL